MWEIETEGVRESRTSLEAAESEARAGWQDRKWWVQLVWAPGSWGTEQTSLSAGRMDRSPTAGRCDLQSWPPRGVFLA